MFQVTLEYDQGMSEICIKKKLKQVNVLGMFFLDLEC